MSATVSRHGLRRIDRALARGYRPDRERIGPSRWLREYAAFKRSARKRGAS
jgi:hypothetical protein